MEDTNQSLAEADAAHDMAIRSAEGIGVPQDWTAAFDHLQRSADLGSRLAQAELAALSGEWILAHDILAGEAVPDQAWSRFRSAIDLAAWLRPLHASALSEKPRVFLVGDAATPDMCRWLIARARAGLRPALVYERTEGQHVSESGRNNTACPFPVPDRDLLLALLRARIAAITGLAVAAMESPHVLHYSVGEEFRPHFDTPDDPNAPGFYPRVLTFLLSLNSDYEGGETTFPRVNGRWKGRTGTALFFWNVGLDGALDRLTLHAGRPVTRGEKWLLSQWIGRPRED